MKKIIFYISIIIAIIISVNIFQVLNLGISRLNEYGFGYLVGKIILLLIFIFIIWKTKRKKLETGFFRTNVEFGRGYAKGYAILVDIVTFKKMKKEKFKGLSGEKILDKYNWEK